jgi:hypothetical protein
LSGFIERADGCTVLDNVDAVAKLVAAEDDAYPGCDLV